MPSLLPGTRWALTPPFHPYRSRRSGGLLSVALSLGSPRAGVTRRLFTVEPGLSSTEQAPPRPPGRLTGGQMGRLAAGVNRSGVNPALDCASLSPCPSPRHACSRTHPSRHRASATFVWNGSMRGWPRRMRTLPQAATLRAKRRLNGSTDGLLARISKTPPSNRWRAIPLPSPPARGSIFWPCGAGSANLAAA